jgi:hypothetical protein
LYNQKQIQEENPSSALLFATLEPDYVMDLKKSLQKCGLKGTVISYEVEKPIYAKSRLWNIACGREAIRQYLLTNTNAQNLIFIDADMIFKKNVINTLIEKLGGNDVVFSGAALKQHGLGLTGFGCVLLKRDTLEKLRFRCFEFKNGEVIFEDNVLEMDLFTLRSRIVKGFFLEIDHYLNSTEIAHVSPQNVGFVRRMVNNNLLRYCLIKSSISLHYNVPWHLKKLLRK